MTTLYGRESKSNISLAEALEKCKVILANAVAILYSPSFCKFAKFENGKLMDEKLQELDIRTVFEARIFSPHAELRWLNVLSGQGRAVLISEQNISQYLDDKIQDLTTVKDGIIDQTYLLWGKGVVRSPSTPQGWSRLSAARIGALDVPIAGIHPKQQVKLIAREYIGLCEGDAGEKYGNVAVLEERLIGLEPLEVKP
jgi:CRISPR-associated protein (TIGR03984 family)